MTHEGDELARELADPVAALPGHFGGEVAYDPRGRNPLAALARRGLIALLRWWLHAAVARQDHFNRLVARALEQLQQASPARLEERVQALEDRQRERESDAALAELEAQTLTAAAAGPLALGDETERAVAEALGARAVLALGEVPTSLLRRLERPLLVSADADVVRRASEAGADARQIAIDVHLQSVADASLAAALSATELVRTPLPALAVRLRRLSRALAPGAPLVLVGPDPASREGLLALWDDPAARRPVTGALLERVLRASGFAKVQVRSAGRHLLAVART